MLGVGCAMKKRSAPLAVPTALAEYLVALDVIGKDGFSSSSLNMKLHCIVLLVYPLLCLQLHSSCQKTQDLQHKQVERANEPVCHT